MTPPATAAAPVVPEDRPVAAVLDDVCHRLSEVAAETVRLVAAGGRVVAAPVLAAGPLPPEPRAAMDGVAVVASDLVGAAASSPVSLRRVGAALAGAGSAPAVATGTCVTIATGARLPDGADTVVRVEEIEDHGDTVRIHRAVALGSDLRRRGEDAAQGATLVEPGSRLGAATLAGVAGAGIDEVTVRRRPRVTVMPTGDELVSGGTSDALGPALGHLLEADGAAVTVTGPVPDDTDALVRAVTTAAAVSDLVVTIGGVGMGPADLAVRALATAGQGRAERLALRPGRPFGWGRVGTCPVLCLPGNPAAALAVAVVLVRPVVARLLATTAPTPATATLATALSSPRGRRELVAARTGPSPATVQASPGHGSADLRRLAATEAFVDVAADVTRLPVGSDVAVWWLS